jgi:hypothetical protein
MTPVEQSCTKLAAPQSHGRRCTPGRTAGERFEERAILCCQERSKSRPLRRRKREPVVGTVKWFFGGAGFSGPGVVCVCVGFA